MVHFPSVGKGTCHASGKWQNHPGSWKRHCLHLEHLWRNLYAPQRPLHTRTDCEPVSTKQTLAAGFHMLFTPEGTRVINPKNGRPGIALTASYLSGMYGGPTPLAWSLAAIVELAV
jgi:hypothetical protein